MKRSGLDAIAGRRLGLRFFLFNFNSLCGVHEKFDPIHASAADLRAYAQNGRRAMCYVR